MENEGMRKEGKQVSQRKEQQQHLCGWVSFTFRFDSFGLWRSIPRSTFSLWFLLLSALKQSWRLFLLGVGFSSSSSMTARTCRENQDFFRGGSSSMSPLPSPSLAFLPQPLLLSFFYSICMH